MTKKTKLWIILFILLIASLACTWDDVRNLLPKSVVGIDQDPSNRISGIVWLDTNMNGLKDEDEDFLGGVDVRVHNKNGEIIASTTTALTTIGENVMGNPTNYLISTFDIPRDDLFRLEFILPSGMRFTIKHDKNITHGSHVYPEGVDVGFNDWDAIYPHSSTGNNAGVVQEIWTFIGDFVWNDLNRNGRQDDGELGVKDIIVTLYDAQTGDEIESTITDAKGWYGFVVSDATVKRTYELEFILPDGFLFTIKDAPDVAFFRNSDVNTSRDMVGWTDLFTVWPGEVNEDLDAGLISVPPTPTSTATRTPTPTHTAAPLPTSTSTATPTEIPSATPTFVIDVDGDTLEFGDAPNPYPVARSDDGAWIMPGTKAFLGKSIDFEIIPNVVDEDPFDDGLVALDFSSREAVLSITLTEEVLTKNDSISKIWLNLYINIVIDINDNGHWGNEGEWIVQNCSTGTQNMPINEPQTIRCPMAGSVSNFEPDGTHWTRVLLSDWQPAQTNWDGTGLKHAPWFFSHGEVEDYKFEDIPTGSTDGTVGVEQAHCRYGDGKAYLHKFGLKEGDLLVLDGRNFLAYWLWVQPIGYDGHCWIAANLVRLPDGLDAKSLPVVDLVLPISGHAPTPTGLSVTRQGDKVTIKSDSSKIGGDDNAGYLAQVWYYQNGNFIAVALHTEKDPPVFEITADKGSEVHVRVRNVHSTGYSQYKEYRGTP